MTPPAFDYEREIPPGYYDKIYREGAGIRFCWHELKFRAVASRIGTPRRLLDIGCGPGTFVGNYLAGVEAVGLDLSAAQVAYAEQTYGSALHRFSAVPVSTLDAGSFDAVTVIELIEHLHPDVARQLLADIRRVLQPGGILVLTTPNYASLWPLIEMVVNARVEVGYDEQHVNKYRRRALRRDLAAAGFRQIEISTAVGLAPFVGALGNDAAFLTDRIEGAARHLGMGNLLVATARP